QRLGVEAARGGGVDGVAGLDGQHGRSLQRKSARRGVKLSSSVPGSSARQECSVSAGMTKASPGPTSKLSPPIVKAKRPERTKVDCTCGWLWGGPSPPEAKVTATSISSGLSATTWRVTPWPASTAG